MRKILPPSRPKRDEERIKKLMREFNLPQTRTHLLFVRGHYLNTMGSKGKDDLNIYDDACFLISPRGVESYNANTNPSVAARNGKALAELVTGSYKFYRGLHKGRYKALRAYPEGVELDCMRAGVPSKCSHINIHKGSSNARARDVVWSEGCLTIPDIQYADWQVRCWSAMDYCAQMAIDVILVENRQTPNGQHWFIGNNQIT